jgi:hypothetical protein
MAIAGAKNEVALRSLSFASGYHWAFHLIDYFTWGEGHLGMVHWLRRHLW